VHVVGFFFIRRESKVRKSEGLDKMERHGWREGERVLLC